MELLKCKVSYSNQLSFTEKYAISFPSIFTAAALICVGEKSAFQGTAMFMTLFFLKENHAELFGLCNFRRLEAPSNCKFLKVRKSCSLFCWQLYMSLLKASSQSSYFVHEVSGPTFRLNTQFNVSATAIELGYTFSLLHLLKYQTYIAKCFIMIISTHLKQYSIFLLLIEFSYNNMTIKFVENRFQTLQCYIFSLRNSFKTIWLNCLYPEGFIHYWIQNRD